MRIPRFSLLTLAMTGAVLVTGCVNGRMPTMEQSQAQAANVHNRSSRMVCDRKNMDSSAYLDCVRRSEHDTSNWRDEQVKKKSAN